MLEVGLAVVSWSIKSAVFFSLSLTYVWGGWLPLICVLLGFGGGEVWLFDSSSMLLVLSSL